MDEAIKTAETKPDEEAAGWIVELAIALGALMVIATMCALVLHWAGVI